MNKHHVVLPDGTVWTRNSQSRQYKYAIYRAGMKAGVAAEVVRNSIFKIKDEMDEKQGLINCLKDNYPFTKEVSHSEYTDMRSCRYGLVVYGRNRLIDYVNMDRINEKGEDVVEAEVRERAIARNTDDIKRLKIRRDAALDLQSRLIFLEHRKGIVGEDTVPGLRHDWHWEHLSFKVLGWSQDLGNAEKRRNTEAKNHPRQPIMIAEAVPTAPPKIKRELAY
tara:strand:+ start:968 stop:1633 length:666 start_codon:yes stop_codon:yes gene_type:complete